MAYGRAHFGDDAFFGFELGNEKEETYSAHRCVHDFEILRTVIDEVWADVEPARRPKLVGPDPHGFHTPIERVEPRNTCTIFKCERRGGAAHVCNDAP